MAAKCSYAYWLTSLRSPEYLNDELRFATAVREAHRHLDGEPSFDGALELLRATIQFHITKRTWVYRTCMDDDFRYDDEDDSMLAKKRRTRLIKNMSIQNMVIRGHDKNKNAVWLVMPRKQAGDDVDGFLDMSIYMIERAIACSEALSRGTSEKIVTILDARNTSSPSVKACMEAINVLQHHYPCRLKNLIILDPPFFVSGIYNIVKPFLDPDTRAKFVPVKGERQKVESLSPLIDQSQASPSFLPGGRLVAPLDGQHFLTRVPFHCVYDDVQKSVPVVPASSARKRKFSARVSTLATGHMSPCCQVTVEAAV